MQRSHSIATVGVDETALCRLGARSDGRIEPLTASTNRAPGVTLSRSGGTPDARTAWPRTVRVNGLPGTAGVCGRGATAGGVGADGIGRERTSSGDAVGNGRVPSPVNGGV